MKTAFGIGIMFIQFFIPVLVLIFCYGKIVWVLTRRINTNLLKTKSEMGNSDNTTGPEVKAKTIRQIVDNAKDKFQTARRNTIKTLLIVGLCFIICWSQNQVLYFMYNCGYDLNFNSTYLNFTVLMVFLNCTVKPFIYLVKYRDYQEALKTFFQCSESGNKFNSSLMSISHSTSLPQA